MKRLDWHDWLRAWAPALLWATVINRLSAIPGDRLPPLPGWNFDKLVHGGIYGVLGALSWWGARATFARARSVAQQIAIATTLTAVYGITDELHQAFTPHRSPDPFDVIADTVGGFLGALVCVAIVARKRNRKHAKSVGDRRVDG
jgi:VanZ family protein